MLNETDPHLRTTCEYSGLPGMAAYMTPDEIGEKTAEKQCTSEMDIDRIIEMAWEDRTPFEAIEMQFGMAEPAVIALMRKHMKPSSFRMWRKRVAGRATKHRALRSDQVIRFKCSRQKAFR